MRRRLVGAAALLGLALAVGATDLPPGDDVLLRPGIRLVEGGELERAVTALEAVLASLTSERTAARATAHVYLGMAHLGLEQGSMARLHLREAWSLRAGEPLDPKRFPPRVIELYEENRPPKAVKKAPARSTTPKPEPKGTSTLPFALGAAAGAGVVGLMRSDGGTETGPTGLPSVRVFNCDDGCRAWLNGQLLSEIGMGQDSGPIDLAGRLRRGGTNVVAFEVTNAHGSISYGFEVRVGETIVFQQVCGVVARTGCEDDKPFPPGVARRYEYVLPRR